MSSNMHDFIALLNKAKWLLGGNVLFAFSQWLLLILFSHFSSPMQLGYYSYALAITAPIFLLSNLQLRPLLIADINLDNRFQFSQYFSLRVITVALAIILCVLFIDWQNRLAMTIFMLVIILKACEAMSEIIYAHYNANKKTVFISQSLTMKSALLVSLSFIALYLTHNLVYSLAATLAGYVVVLFLMDIRKSRSALKPIKIADKQLKALAIMGLPLGISVMMISLQTNIPRYFLERYFSVELVGVYTILYYFLLIGSIVIGSVCQYLSPYFSEYYHQSKKSELTKVVKQALGIALALGVAGLAISLPLHHFIIQIIYGSDYTQYSYLLPYIMAAGVFTYLSIVFGYLLTSLQLLKIQLPIFMFLAAMALVYSYIFIPKYGVLGAAYTTILSALSQLLISASLVGIKIHRMTAHD